jgi:hypothetical protein
MNHKIDDGAQISEDRIHVMSARIILGDILTIVGMVTLSILGMYLALPDSKVRRFYFAAYLVWTLFIVIKSWLHKEPFTLRDRFFILLFSALVALSSLVQAVRHSWDEKTPVLSWIFSASYLVIAIYQFLIFSSKDGQELQ